MRAESEKLSNEILEKGLCYSCRTELLCLQIWDKVGKKNWPEIVKRAETQSKIPKPETWYKMTDLVTPQSLSMPV